MEDVVKDTITDPHEARRLVNERFEMYGMKFLEVCIAHKVDKSSR